MDDRGRRLRKKTRELGLLASPVRRARSNFENGIKSMPVRVVTS